MAIDEAIKEMDLSIPQHFTKEQSVWIKAYCIKRNIEFYNKAIDDFASKLIMHFADWKLSSAPFNDDETDGIEEIICETIENAIGGVEEIAEQLKATTSCTLSAERR